MMFKIFPIGTVYFSKCSRTNLLNITKMFIFVIFNVFFIDSFFNPINPIIFIFGILHFVIIRHSE
ncbi:hypothetical protein C1645_788418 [Glomus cerebriforme]|uniref:Uncharacterized protein n=1 Tax=Glomus cerebriforme TaxID=658196 RepID=A0A397SAA9_9GLOM|nr:hypothetical protein C1645_788418 [Glomus cerebriforme]